MFFGNGFAVGYFILCLLIPFLNSMLNGLEKEQFKRMVITLLIIWCIVPTVTMGVWGDNFGKISGFIIMYLLGAYIRLYGLNIMVLVRKCVGRYNL